MVAYRVASTVVITPAAFGVGVCLGETRTARVFASQKAPPPPKLVVHVSRLVGRAVLEIATKLRSGPSIALHRNLRT